MSGDGKNLGIAYILAIVAPFFSLHRHYLGKHGSAILQMLLWFTGIGAIWFFIDLIMMNTLVKEANMQLGYYEDRDIYIENEYTYRKKRKLPETTESKENQVLKVAKKYNGRVTVTQVAMETPLSLEEAEKFLKDMVRKSYANMSVDDKGVIHYEFYELM